MVTYGLSVASNLCEVSWVQAKKSLSDGDSLSAMRNDVNNATFANLGRILVGRFGDQTVGIYGTRLFTKISTISKFCNQVYDASQLYKYSFAFSHVNKSFWTSKLKWPLVFIGYVPTMVQVYNLFNAIFGDSELESDKWILY
jgi:hypothetical protein